MSYGMQGPPVGGLQADAPQTLSVRVAAGMDRRAGRSRQPDRRSLRGETVALRQSQDALASSPARGPGQDLGGLLTARRAT
jgi:hypothetical protein